MKNLRSYIQSLIQEMTTTGDIEGFNTAFAFSNDTKKQKKLMKKHGYEVVDDKEEKREKSPGERKQTCKRIMPTLSAATLDTRLKEAIKKINKNVLLSEAKYKDFKNDNSVSTKKKLNQAIKKINGDLFRLERMVNHIDKLKNETEYSSDKYWTSTKNALSKSQDRLNRLLIKLKKL
jgi:hypothetical protein